MKRRKVAPHSLFTLQYQIGNKMTNIPYDTIVDIVLENLFKSNERFSNRLIDLIGPGGKTLSGTLGTANIAADVEGRTLSITTVRQVGSVRHTATYHFSEAGIEHMRVEYLGCSDPDEPMRTLDGEKVKTD